MMELLLYTAALTIIPTAKKATALLLELTVHVKAKCTTCCTCNVPYI